ncbi:hypothetical protein MKX03_010420 [Papaver bracteatum]|nr:hypothetical protein MKX03_010420 [Papaver bracteatum]
MAVTWRRPTGSVATLLAIITCMAVCTDMASAWWANICTRGDTYIERNINGATSCASCTNFCSSMCSDTGGSVVRDECQPSGWYNCACCCSHPPTSSPSLPPTPSSGTPFTDGAHNTDNICSSEQKYLMIPHTKGPDCTLRSQCDNRCKEEGAFVGAGSQCIGTSGNGQGTNFQWFEQCCCNQAPPPSPPPPPPPPPSPPPTPSPSCGCCASDINIQISVKSGGGCGDKSSSTPSTCGAKSPSTTHLTL